MHYTYMPVSIALKDKECLVVGGGLIALRKVETLLDYDTEITVIAPRAVEKIEYHASRERIKIEKREYRSPEASGYGIVISASDDNELNRTVADDCRRSGVPVNVVDAPHLSTFIFPAVVRRGYLTAAISTDGKAPFISGHLRLVLGNIFPEHWEKLVEYAIDFRKKVRTRWGSDSEKKAACYARFLEADWKELLADSNDEAITEQLARMLEF
jgi:siroheme synthase-like protein